MNIANHSGIKETFPNIHNILVEHTRTVDKQIGLSLDNGQEFVDTIIPVVFGGWKGTKDLYKKYDIFSVETEECVNTGTGYGIIKVDGNSYKASWHYSQGGYDKDKIIANSITKLN